MTAAGVRQREQAAGQDGPADLRSQTLAQMRGGVDGQRLQTKGGPERQQQTARQLHAHERRAQRQQETEGHEPNLRPELQLRSTEDVDDWPHCGVDTVHEEAERRDRQHDAIMMAQ